MNNHKPFLSFWCRKNTPNLEAVEELGEQVTALVEEQSNGVSTHW